MNQERIKASLLLKQLCTPGALHGMEHTALREQLISIRDGLHCCIKDIDADGNCPMHPEHKMRVFHN